MPAPVNKEKLIAELKSVSKDFKGDVIAAEIVDNGIAEKDLYFKNISIFKRFIAKDVENVSWNDELPEQLIFEMNREGLYDMLPEGISHSTATKTTNKDVTKEFQLHREEERDARQFFSIFENEFFHYYLRLEIIEREIFNNKNLAKNRSLFEYFYGNSKFLTDIQVITLLHLLPIAHKIRSDVKTIEGILSKIINYKITVSRKQKNGYLKSDNYSGICLDEAVLGINSVLSDSCIICRFCYEITIWEIDSADYKDFITGGKNKNVLDFVLPYFFPADSEVLIDLLPTKESKDFTIYNEESLCFLGFNSYISL